MIVQEQVELIYAAYPRKVGKGDAKKAIEKALKKVSFDVLLAAVTEYAEACEKTGRDRGFIPHPATWFNQERWDDDRADWWHTTTRDAGRESSEQFRQRKNLEAIAGFMRRRGLPTGDAGPRRLEANGDADGGAA